MSWSCFSARRLATRFPAIPAASVGLGEIDVVVAGMCDQFPRAGGQVSEQRSEPAVSRFRWPARRWRRRWR